MATYHHFNVDIAVKYGVLEAVLLENIKFWVDKNRANEKNIFEGRPWTYNSIKAFTELFPYASDGQIRRALKKLEIEGLILTGNYNKLPYDRTMWYALSDFGESIFQNKNIHFSNLTNGDLKNDKPILDNKPDINPNNNTPPGEDRNTSGYPSQTCEKVENSVETVENESKQDAADMVLKYFLFCYQYHFGKAHEPIQPEKLEYIKRIISENHIGQQHVNAYFGDDGSAEGTKPLYGKSDAKIYHFVSPGVIEILKRRCGE